MQTTAVKRGVALVTVLASITLASAVQAAAADRPGRPSAAGTDAVEGLVYQDELRIDLDRLVPLVFRRNLAIGSEEMGWQVSEERVNEESALYDPELFSSYEYGRVDNPTTAEEYFNQSFLDEFYERSHTYKAGIGGLLPTGARWTVGYRMYNRTNELIRSRYDYEFDREYQAILEVTLKQPLLRNAGIDVTTAKWRIADIDRQIAFQRYRLRSLQIAESTINAFWYLVQAQQMIDILEDSLGNRQRLAEMVGDRVAYGKSSASEATEARAAVALRNADLSSARQDRVRESNRIRELLSIRRTAGRFRVAAVGAAFTRDKGALDFEASLDRALENWPEYLIANLSVARAEIEEEYADNQALPELNLMGGYGHAGLSVNRGSALSDSTRPEHPSWNAGIEFRMPITNEAARSAARAATLRYRQAMLEKAASESAIENTLDTIYERIEQARAVVGDQELTTELRERVLEAEMTRLSAGKGRVSDVIDKDEALIEARIAELESRIELENALTAVALAEGTLLDRYGVRLRLADVR